jgi:hypothetical protein
MDQSDLDKGKIERISPGDGRGEQDVDISQTGKQAGRPLTEEFTAVVESPSVLSAGEEDDKKKKRERRRSSRKMSEFGLPDMAQNPDWVRSFDDQHNIYYYNTKTQLSTWLAPCCRCGEISDKWCLNCEKSYCEHDFTKKHDKSENRKQHRWTFKEVPPPMQLMPGDVYCIVCERKAAFKMCTECWDPYCLQCFSLVHHIGSLKFHKAIPYKRVATSWVTVKNGAPDGSDLYVHAERGVSTTDKPFELLSDFERITAANIKTHKDAAEEHLTLIEKLKAELVIAKIERDRMVVETSKALQEMRAKAMEKEDEELQKSSKSGKLK